MDFTIVPFNALGGSRSYFSYNHSLNRDVIEKTYPILKFSIGCASDP